MLVDAGDALTRSGLIAPQSPAAAVEREKARLVVATMGALGYDALAVGERDLFLGLDELKKLAAESKVALLAANVLDAEGKKPFLERRIVKAGATRVGVFAVARAGPGFDKAGLKVLGPASVAQGQVDLLRKEGATFVVALLHLDYDASLKLAAELKGVDFAVQSHDGRSGIGQLVGTTWLAAGGEQGRQLGRAAFSLAGAGPYVDLREGAGAAEQLPGLEQTIAQTEQRMKAEPERKEQWARSLDAFRRRRDELKAKAQSKPPAGRRTIAIDAVPLDARVADAPEAKKKVDAFVARHGSTVEKH